MLKGQIIFIWSDELAKEFARVASGGAYLEYKGCKTLDQKLKRFKQLKTQAHEKV